MFKRITLISTLCAVFVLQALPLAAAEGHYRWKDENGKFHYSDRPPAGVDAEFVELATGRTSSKTSTTPTTAEEPQKTSEASTEENTEPMKIEVPPGKDPALCAQAKANLAALSKPQVRITEADGSKRLLTMEEKASEVARAQKFIDIYCE